jgi:hypothetical protein
MRMSKAGHTQTIESDTGARIGSGDMSAVTAVEDEFASRSECWCCGNIEDPRTSFGSRGAK